ncbi:KAP family P-loop NTPase fold protein [Archangium lansingense]|uniref:P-loop NTPase fold protein n=1 Tax=Archangium lansingense TaxID=2995310 RepID=A0ABT4A326_9BACT|nr:P-loop NTPase fold protein [Archangium lansinium]MCY1075998.1 P-loop NTPase fold protein [Archangium lansinium]
MKNPPLNSEATEIPKPGAGSSISSDRPIDSLEADRYGLRQHFIPRLARLALEWPTRDGLVVGLFGSWGIGKTSILYMFRDYVNQSRERYKNVIFASFNPWFYEDTGALITSFFATIAAEISVDEKTPWAQAAGALKAMGSFLTAASKGISIFGVNVDAEKIKEAAKIATDALNQTGEITSSLTGLAELAGAGQKKLEKHRTDVENALKKLGESGGRVAVLIDDVDRLNKSELLSLLRLVRTVADLPYVTLVVSMDDVRVRDVLGSAVSEGYGQGYLDKIVQVPLHVPLPSREAMATDLAAQLEMAFKSRGVPLPVELTPTQFSSQRTALGLLVSLVRTPRDLARYMNGLRTLLLAGEDPDVHPTDAALIEALHIFYPDVYDRVRRHKDFLTGSSYDNLYYGSATRDREQAKTTLSAKLEQIIRGGVSTLGTKSEESIQGLLTLLFGDLTDPEANRDEAADAAERKIRSPVAFDNYFRYAPSIGAVMRGEVDALLEKLLSHARAASQIESAVVLAEAFTGRGQQAAEQMMEDLGYRLRSIDLGLLEWIGKGVIAITEQLPSDITLGLLAKVLEAMTRFQFEDERRWSDKEAQAQARNLLMIAIHSPLSVVQLYTLTMWSKHLVNEEVHRELAAAWLQRLDKYLQEGDLFGEPDVEEAPKIFPFAMKMITVLDEASPVSLDAFRSHLVEYVERLPQRLPQALYLVSSVSNNIPRSLSENPTVEGGPGG